MPEWDSRHQSSLTHGGAQSVSVPRTWWGPYRANPCLGSARVPERGEGEGRSSPESLLSQAIGPESWLAPAIGDHPIPWVRERT